MNEKTKRWHAKGKWTIKPCVLGLITGTVTAAGLTSIVSFLIMKKIMTLQMIGFAKYLILGAAACVGTLIAVRASGQKKILSAAITCLSMLLMIGILSLLLPGQTGKGIWISFAICGASFLLTILIPAGNPRKKYLS